jgi:zinc protease
VKLAGRRLAAAHAAALLALAAAGRAEQIPAHPTQLRFPELPLRLPSAEGHRHVLANGVPVYVVTDRTVPLVDVVIGLRVGSFLDPSDRPGVASLTGAMLRRGGTQSRSADDLDTLLDSLGAELQSVTGERRGGASLSCTTAVLDEALAILFEVLRSPAFEESRLAWAKANLSESLNRAGDDPLEILEREWRTLIFGAEDDRSRRLTGADLEGLERDDLIEFHRAYWRPANMVLAVSGDVAAEEILPALEKHFAGWEVTGPEIPWPPPTADHVPEPGFYLVEKDIPQSKVLLGHRAPARRSWDDPASFANEVMTEILGGSGTSSRLLSRLRLQESLVYQAGARWESALDGEGELRISLQTKSSDVLRAVAIALEEVRRLRSEPVGPDELALAKRNLLDRFPLLFDTPVEISGRFAEDELLGRPHVYWESYRERIAQVRSGQVWQAARRHLRPERMVLLVVGPWREIAAAHEAGAPLLPAPFDVVKRLPRRDPPSPER